MINGLSRRDFMKLGLAATTAGAIAPTVLPLGAQAAPPDPNINYEEVLGYCPFCQSRCTFNVLKHDGKARFLVGRQGNLWTGGGMCPKGMSLLELVESPHRLTQPMLKVDGKWQNISYDEAVDIVVQKLQEAREKRGDAISKSLALTAPLWDCRESELAALMTFHFAGGVNVMPPGEVCISTASSTLSTLLGVGNSTTTVDELENAELLVLWGANISETYPPYTRWLERALEKGVKIIYMDCRKTRTSNFATKQYQPKPGTDGALALGCLRHLITTGAYDRAYVEANTNNFEMLVENSQPWTVEEVARTTGLSADEIQEFYRDVVASKRTMMWMGGSISRYANGMPTVRAIVALQVITNNVMGSGQGILTMESGKPEGEDEFIEHVCGPAPAGVNFRRLLMSMNREEIDVFFLNSSYRRYPDCNNVKAAFEKVGFTVCRGFFHTEELDVADLFVPATFTLESQGSHYGAEKQVVWRDKCQDAPGACVPDWQFYRDIGKKMFPDKYPDFADPEALHALFVQAVPDWTGITVERLRESPGGLVGPIPEADGPEQLGVIFKDGKYRTPDGKLDFLIRAAGGITWTPPRGAPYGDDGKPEFPLTFIQGKVVTQWQQTMTNFAASLAQFSNGRYVLVNPETAGQLNVKHGDNVYLTTEFGQVEARVEASDEILPGVVFTPSHFIGTSPHSATNSAPINTILPNYWDRISAQFNGLGCTLKPM